MRLPLLTLGVFSIFSGYFFALGLVLGAFVEDALDGKDDFGKVRAGPAGETRNKAFNHCSGFTSSSRDQAAFPVA
jgi:hypothetical protein